MTKLGKRGTIASGYLCALLTTTALVSPLVLATPAAAVDYTGSNGAMGATGSFPNTGCVCNSGQAGGTGGANGFGGGNAADGAANRGYANSSLGGGGGGADGGGGGGAYYSSGAGGSGGGAGGAGYLLTDSNTLTSGGAITGGNGGDGGYSTFYYGVPYYSKVGGGGGGGGGSGVIATGTSSFTNTGTILGGTGGTGAFANYADFSNTYAHPEDAGSGGAGGFGIRADGATSLTLSNSGNITGGDAGYHAFAGMGAGSAGIYGQNITLYNTGGTIMGGYGATVGAGIELTGGVNTLNISAGTITSSSYGLGIKVDGGTNIFNISGGSVTPGSGAAYALQINGGTNTLNVTGGTLGVVYLAGGVTTLEGGAYSNTMTLAHGATASVTTAGGDVSGITSFDNHGGLSLDAGRSLTLGAFTNESDGTLTLGAGATLVSTNLNLVAGSTITGAGSLSSGSAAYSLASGSISAALAGTGGLNKTGSGTLTLTGANTYTGGTTIDGGTLSVGIGALGGGDVTMAQGTTIQFTGASFTTSNNFYITGDPVFDVTTGNSQTVSGVIADADPMTPGIVEKTGAGELVLSGANTYTGGTVISAGTLTVGVGSVRDTNFALVSSAIGLGTLTLDGGTLSTDTYHTLYNDILVNSTGGTIDSGANFFEVFGDIADGSGGAGTLTIAGTTGGAVSLGGTNSYSAATVVAAGATLQPASFDSLSANSNYTVNGTLNLRQVGGGDFTIKSLAGSGNVTNTLAGNSILTIATGAAQSVTFAGTITDYGGGNPHVGIAINGAGTQIFSQSNNYSGGTTLTAGTLEIGNAGALGSGTVTFDGGTLKTDGAYALGNAIQVNAGGGTLNNNTHDITLSGAITDGAMPGVLALIGSGDTSLTGDNSGFSGGLSAAATLTLNGATTAGSGAIALGSNATLAFGTASDSYANDIKLGGGNTIDIAPDDSFTGLTLTGVISDAGATPASLTVLSSGTVTPTLTLTNANSYSGGTTFYAGNLVADNDSALGTGAINFNGGNLSTDNTSLTLGNAIAIADFSYAAISVPEDTLTLNGVISGANGALHLSDTPGMAPGTIVLNGHNSYGGSTEIDAVTAVAGTADAFGTGEIVVTNGGTLKAAGGTTLNIANQIVVKSSGGMVLGNGTTLTLSGNIIDDFGPGALTVGAGGAADTSTVVLSGSNSFSGGLTIAGGAVQAASSTALGDSAAAVTMNGGTALVYNSGLTIANAINLMGDATFSVAASSTATQSGDIGDDAPANPYTVTKAGTGTLVWSGTNTSSANVKLNAGTLEIASQNALGGGAYIFDGGTLTVDGSYLIHNDFQVMSGGTFDTGIYDTELSGALSSDSTDGVLTLIGTGSVKISGLNNLSGGAALAANSTLEVAGTSGLGAGDVSMAAGSSILFTTTSGTFTNNFTLDGDPVFDVATGLTTTLSGVISDLPAGTPGVLEKIGAGTLVLAAANTYSGGTILTAGILQADNNAALGSGTLTLDGGTLTSGINPVLANAIAITANGGTVQADDNTIELSGVISDASGGGLLSLASGNTPGIVILGSANTYSQGTSIGSHVTALARNNASFGTGTITLDGGVMTAVGNLTIANDIALTDNGGTILGNGTTLTLSGVIADAPGYTGALDSGLIIGSAGANDTSTVILSGNNTYSGGSFSSTEIAGGTVVAASDSAFSSTYVTIDDGATLSYGAGRDIGNSLLLNGAATLNVASGTATQSGDIGEVNPSSLTKTGAGTLVLNGGNNYSGATIVSAGTLEVSSFNGITYNSDVEVASGAVLAFDGAMGSVDIGSLADHAGAGGTVTIGTGTELFVGGAGDNSNNTTFSGTVTGGDLAYDGAGTLTLTGGANSVEALTICACVTTGGITLSGGHMAVSDMVDAESGTLTVQNGAVLDVSGLGFASTGGAVVVTGVGSAITVDTDTGVTTDNTLAASQTIAAGGSFTTTGDSYIATDGTPGATATGLVTGAGSVWTADHFYVGSGVVGGKGTLTIADGGKVVAPDGITLALGSTLNIGNGGLAGIIDAPTISGGGSNKVVADFTDSSTLSAQLTGGLTLTKQGSGTLILTGANTNSGLTTISGGTLQIGDGGATGKLGTGAVTDNATLAFNTSTPTTLASIINGSGGLVQQGSGALTLTATDGYTGETSITANSTLKLTGSGRIQSSSVVTDNGVLDISGVAGGTAIQTLAGSGSVLLGSQTLQFLNGSTTFSGSITDGGAGGSVEFGAGDQVLTGTNSWTGTTTINAGATVTVDSPDSLGGSSITFFNGSVLKFTAGGTYTLPANFAQVHAPVYDVGSSTVTWSGQITGVGDLAVTGNGGTLVLTNVTNSYGGGTEVYGGAALKVDADGELGATATTLQLGDATTTGTLRFASAFTLNAARSIVLGAGGGIIDTNGNTVTIAQAISGASLTKAGAGNLILTGTSSFTGPAIVNAGILSVNGTIASGATVNAGGTLGGTGTVGATTVASGGTIAPGNSIGTLHVNGNLTLASGSTTAIEISPTAADQIAVSGTAALGGTLAFSQGAGTYTTGTDFKLITASSVSGVFSGVTGLNVTGLDANVLYSATAVDLTLTTPAANGGGSSGGGSSGGSSGGGSSGGGTVTNSFLFGTYGKTPNQIAAGAGLAAGANTGTLYVATGNLVAANLASVPGALGQMAGDIHASIRGAVIEDSRIIRDAVLGRLDQAGEQSAVWGSAFGGYGSIAGDGNAAALHHDSAGFIAGADMPVSDGIRLGLAAAYSTDRASTTGHLSTAGGNNGHIIGYAGWTGDAFDLKLGGDYGWGTVHTARQVTALGQTVAGRQDQRMGQVFADAGYRIATDQWAFEPYVDIAHVEATSGSFAEQGGSAALSGGSVTDGLTYGTLGLRAALAGVSLDDIGIAPKIDLGWRHAFDTLKPGQIVRFQDTGTSFAVLGVPLGTDAAALQLGFDVTLTPDAKLSLGYDGTFGSRVQNNAVRGAFQWAF